jgi:alkanesulfonate monooxygenase SsuD/methylene tetrahydromethanopterin reductase-like flavin-dependent oxidoreductase (luciferase family)
VLDSCLYTAPGKFGGGGAGTTWLVGSADEVAAALRKLDAAGASPVGRLALQPAGGSAGVMSVCVKSLPL